MIFTVAAVKEGEAAPSPARPKGTFGTLLEASLPEVTGLALSSTLSRTCKVKWGRGDEGDSKAAFSKGIGTANVKQGLEPGIYCIEVPGFVPRGAQATPEYAANNSVSVFVKFGGTASCAFPKVEVQTYNAGGRLKEPFYFVAYR
ncbi:MAG TPA: hypothetical protein VHR65_03650 [Solirubrobacterales bacterium]|nr:hypothetical protein [Solirubrobacterales bacterium]